MILIRFAISMFALALLGLAVSYSTAQSGEKQHAPAVTGPAPG
jgi:hypothetical protein